MPTAPSPEHSAIMRQLPVTVILPVHDEDPAVVRRLAAGLARVAVSAVVAVAVGKPRTTRRPFGDFQN